VEGRKEKKGKLALNPLFGKERGRTIIQREGKREKGPQSPKSSTIRLAAGGRRLKSTKADRKKERKTSCSRVFERIVVSYKRKGGGKTLKGSITFSPSQSMQ